MELHLFLSEMRRSGMKIIDATLRYLDAFDISADQGLQFLNLYHAIGISHFVLSKKLYRLLYERLPLENEYYMFLEEESDKKLYPQIKHFIMHKSLNPNMISEIQLNDIREIIHIKKYTQAKAVLIHGMEDFMCYDYKKALEKISSTFFVNNIILSPDNDKDCAVALATMFVHFGGKAVMGSFAGIGQLAPTEQLIMSLRLTQRFKVNQDLANIVVLKTLFEEITNMHIPGKMPVIGDKIFQVESGIHIDGIMKNQSNYETYPPELVGQKREIVIGKHSGTNSIRYKAKELQLSYEENNLMHMLQVIKATSIRQKRSLTDREFAEIIRQGR